ncbi:HERV-H LTR-associating protein 2 [Paramormyrops kingsleyae]|uniref:HERV-H LTR-associating protein 2 n=1 Tax=Paramormyrops kingsleyae TaxID=1676925 RepID=UPI003B96D23E
MAGGLVRACVCLWILTTADCRTPDIQVTCTFAQDCLLPCIFEPASSVNVSWQQQEDLFLTFRLGAGPEELLLPSYADRASLFEEQVSHGNASLQIKQTSTQDRGRYRCTVSTDRAVEDTIVIVRVEAPLRSLTLEITGDCRAVKCSSQDVYPAPHLSWSTEPSLQPELLRPSTHMAANKLGLYSVESRLNRPKTGSGYTYTCTIKTSYGSQTWMASLRDTEMRPTEGTQVTIPCTAPRNLQNFTLTWSFTRQRQLSIILTYDSLTRHVTNHWGKRAHLDHNWASSGDGSLHLQDLGSSAQTGMYICIISTPRTKYLTYTSVNVSAISGVSEPDERVQKGRESRLWLICIAVVAVALCVGAVWCVKKKDGDSHPPAETTEMRQFTAGHRENGTPQESSPLAVA